jgi:CDP-glycerol glycerophosphotransferase
MKIVYHSFGGRYSDNPRALYESLVARGHRDRHVWLADPGHEHGFPAGVETVRFGSDRCIEELESADVVVSNTHIELSWHKAPGTRYLQTWHGTR